MKKTKLFAGAFIALALLVSSFALPAQAVNNPNWDASGSWVINMEYQGTQHPHDMTLAQDSLGALTGSGGSPAGGNVYTWALTSGSVSGNTIDFMADYTATVDAVIPQTTLHVIGTIASDGTISGTWSDNYQGGSRSGAVSTVSGSADLLGALAAEDFGVVDYDTGMGILSGYTAGFGLTDANFEDVQSVVVRLYAGATLLQTNTATAKVGDTILGSQISSPFDVSGSFAYAADGYWVNVRETEYGQSVPATRVVADVILENGKVLTAENTNLTGNPEDIFPPENVAPVLSNVPVSPVSIPELAPYSFDSNATDTDGDTLVFSLSGQPAGAGIDSSSGVFSWTPSEAQGPGSYTFDVRVSDGALMDTESITINVTEVPEDNNAPVLSAITSPVTIPELAPYSFDADATDADGDTLVFSLSGQPSGATINSTTGVFDWTPSEAQGPGSYTFDVMVSDGSLSDSQSATIHVTEVDDAPEPTDNPQSKSDCMAGGWSDFGFRNQGQCIRFVNTGGDSR